MIMHWLNLHASTLNSPEFTGAEPVDRATWLCLSFFCATQENGGRIINAREWCDRRWQQLVRVTREEVSRTSELWAWTGPDITISFYPVDKEREVKAKRNGGLAVANARWHGSSPSSVDSSGDSSQPSSGDSSVDSSPKAELYAEVRNKEKGKRKVEGGSAPAREAPPPPPSFSKKVKMTAAMLLAELGIPNPPQAVAEWRGGINNIAKCRSLEEARTFIRWASDVLKFEGVVIQHWRQVRELAEQWDSEYRKKIFPSGEDHASV